MEFSNLIFSKSQKIVEIIIQAREICAEYNFPNIMSKDSERDIRNNAGMHVRTSDASPAARSRNYQTNYPSSMRSTPFKTE